MSKLKNSISLLTGPIIINLKLPTWFWLEAAMIRGTWKGEVSLGLVSRATLLTPAILHTLRMSELNNLK